MKEKIYLEWNLVLEGNVVLGRNVNLRGTYFWRGTDSEVGRFSGGRMQFFFYCIFPTFWLRCTQRSMTGILGKVKLFFSCLNNIVKS